MEELRIANLTAKDVFKTRAIQIQINEGTFWFRFWWYLWAADIWFGNFPLLKFIIGVNIVVLTLGWWLR